jgi:predicted nucleotidyltransferase
MRLSRLERENIKKIITDYTENAQIYLFGSRVDESKSGGDIDLYVKVSDKPHFLLKPRILAQLKRVLGEQKIDLVFGYPQKALSLIDKEATTHGALL